MVCIRSLRPLGSLPHSRSQAGLTAHRWTSQALLGLAGRPGGAGGRTVPISYPPACRPEVTLNSRERILAASVYLYKFKNWHLDLLKQTTEMENEE